MRTFVFTDRALERQAGRFVWLSINYEKANNAEFLDKYPIEILPTLLVIDPESERAVLRWVGSATVPQLEKLFGDGERAYANKGSGADAALASADRLQGAGKKAEAVTAFKEALSKAPPEWPPRDRVVKSLLDGGMSLQRVRRAWEFLNRRAKLDQHLAEVKLITDGQSIFKVARRNGEILDALRNGQLAFFVAIDDIASSVEADVRQFREDRDRFLRALRDAAANVQASGARRGLGV